MNVTKVAQSPAQDDLLAGCARIIGAAHLISGDEDHSAIYWQNWTGQFSGIPLAVVQPKSTQEVAKIVRLCRREAVAVVPSGGRTGICGGGVPVSDGDTLLILLERMSAVRASDLDARSITVEGEAILQTMQDHAVENALIFPLTFGAR